MFYDGIENDQLIGIFMTTNGYIDIYSLRIITLRKCCVMYIFITTLQSGPNLIPFTRKLHFISAFNGQSLADFKEINKRKRTNYYLLNTTQKSQDQAAQKNKSH
jgi:hypothetical protein